MMRDNKTNRNQAKQTAKETTMKWIMMTLAVLALIFVFSDIGAQAQPGGGGGGGCSDPTGAPIPCPQDPTTDDDGEPCDDEDNDRVCDADEPESCVGEPNDDGEGCADPDSVSPIEALIGMIESVQPEIPNSTRHKDWIQILSVGNAALEMGLFSFSVCDEDFNELLKQAARGDFDAIQKLNELIQECAGDGSLTKVEIKDSGSYTTWYQAADADLFMLCVASSTEERGACDIVSTRPTGGVRVAVGDVNGIIILEDESPLVFASSTPPSSDSGFDFDWYGFNYEAVNEIEQALRDDLETIGEFEDEVRQALEQLENWIGNVKECDLVEPSSEQISFPFHNIKPVFDALEPECADDVQADGDFNGDGSVGASDFIIWNVNPGSSKFDEVYMLVFPVPGTDAIIAVLIGLFEDPEDVEPRARKIFIGELSVTKPDHEIDGEPED